MQATNRTCKISKRTQSTTGSQETGIQTKSGASPKAKDLSKGKEKEKLSSRKDKEKVKSSVSLKKRSVENSNTAIPSKSNTVIPSDASKDVFSIIASKLEPSDIQNLRETSKGSENLATEYLPPLRLSAGDIKGSSDSILGALYNVFVRLQGHNIINPKLDFLQQRNVKIAISVETDSDIETLTSFMEDPDNQNLIKNIDSISFSHVTESNSTQIEHLITILSEKSPKLTNLSFHNLYVPLNVPTLPKNLQFLSFGHLHETLNLPNEFPKSLLSFSCGEIAVSASLNLPAAFPEGLISLSIGYTYQNPLTIPLLPDTLQFLSIGAQHDIPAILPAALKSFTIEWIQAPLDLTTMLPEHLESLSFLLIENSITFPPTFPNTLQSLSLGTVAHDINLPAEFPDNLKSLSINFSRGAINLPPLPDELESLVLYEFDDQIQLPDSLESLEIKSVSTPLNFRILPTSLKVLNFGNIYSSVSFPSEFPKCMQSLQSFVFIDIFDFNTRKQFEKYQVQINANNT